MRSTVSASPSTAPPTPSGRCCAPMPERTGASVDAAKATSRPTPPWAPFHDRYEPEDDGLRFQQLRYEGNRPDLPSVADGILGDKTMRSRARTSILEPLDHDDVLRDGFSLDELND